MERRGRPGEGPEARLSSKREVRTRHLREQKEERKAVISPSFSRESTQALAGCLPSNGSTAWTGGTDRERGLRLGLVARGRFKLGIPRGQKEERNAVISSNVSRRKHLGPSRVPTIQ